MLIKPSDAAFELIRRRRARGGMLDFTQYTNHGYRAANHHKIICDKLDKCFTGEIKRLIISMPPRHGKSELASRRFPAYWLGRKPDSEIVCASYNQNIAGDFGRDVRDIFNSDAYRKIFPNVNIRKDMAATSRWGTNSGGIYISVGVQGGLTGKGADLLLIDDPTKDRKDADSLTKQEAVWDWFTSTAYTRLYKNSVCILIATRWHENDLIGRALQRDGDKWDILTLPAIDDEGMALWPDEFPLENLNEIKAMIGSRDWNSLYQQNPSPDEAMVVKTEWLEYYYDELPSGLKYIITGDTAYGEKKENDYSVFQLWGSDGENAYLVDQLRGQWDFPKLLDKLGAFYSKCKSRTDSLTIPLHIESKVSGISLIQTLQKETNMKVEPIIRDSNESKYDRLNAQTPHFEYGRVKLPRNALWVEQKEGLKYEFMNFRRDMTHSTHDDQVDPAVDAVRIFLHKRMGLSRILNSNLDRRYF